MDLPRYDLHCHSTASDGVLSPLEILARAQQRGVEILALTDHDTVSGVRDIVANQPEGLRVIPGAEFTCQWNGRIVHIIGLGLDLASTELSGYFLKLDLLRRQRAEEIARRLVKLGLPDLLECAAQHAAGGSIGRPHFARAMVTEKVIATEQQAFKKYLGAGKKGDVKVEWPELSETIMAIKNASGLSILAHPTKYKMTFTKIREVIQGFVELGGAGIEVSYPGITLDHQKHLVRIAKNNGLLLSAGSDFHSPGQGWADLGKFMPVPESENHVLKYLL